MANSFGGLIGYKYSGADARAMRYSISLVCILLLGVFSLLIHPTQQNLNKYGDFDGRSLDLIPMVSDLEDVRTTTITSGGAIKTGVSLADLNGDGINEMLWANSSGTVFAYGYSQGQGYHELWNYTADGGQIWSSLIVSDINKDGSPEILFGTFNQAFYCLSANGTLLWSYNDGYANPVNVNGALGDVDGDGWDEFIGSKFDKLYCINATGDEEWSYGFDAHKIDGITLRDITGDKVPEILFNLDNNTLMILYGNGSQYNSLCIERPIKTAPLVVENMIIIQNGTILEALDLSFNELWTVSLNHNITTPVAGDINHDGQYEIVANCIDENITLVYSLNGTLLYMRDVMGTFSQYSIPALGDLNNDTIPDIAVASSVVYLLDGELNELYNHIPVSYGVNYPVLGDVNGDGVVELVFSDDVGKIWIGDLLEGGLGTPWPFVGNSVERSNILFDSDHDGLADYFEHIIGTNIQDPDSDSDGIDDWKEVNLYGSDPLSTDSDNDGMPDPWEIDYGLNANDASDAVSDADSDELNNLQEYNAGTNPLVNDTDRDGLSDGWEIKYDFNPLDPDDAALDFDGDGLTNLEEFHYNTDPKSNDTDGDGMPDNWEFSNDLNPLCGDDASTDDDNDGVINLYEFLNGTNPKSNDTDGDGMPDGWELLYSLEPTINDSSEDPDKDGLSNISEFLFGTDPKNADTDDDGFSDGQEIKWKTDPNNPGDNIKIRGIIGGVSAGIILILGFLLKRKIKGKKTK